MKAKEAVIRLEKVTVEAGKRKLLDDACFEAMRGDFTALVGPNGAGKTTLLRTILGFNRISSGRVEVFGLPSGAGSINEVRKRSGYMPQSLAIDRFFPVHAGDVIRMAAGAKEAAEAAEELKITRFLNSPFGLLSGGERQKVLLAMALARKPELLLLDEPNLNLDPFAYRDFLSTVDRVHVKHGLTVVFITHLITQVPVSCKKVAVMKNGRITLESTARKILNRKNSAELIYG